MFIEYTGKLNLNACTFSAKLFNSPAYLLCLLSFHFPDQSFLYYVESDNNTNDDDDDDDDHDGDDDYDEAYEGKGCIFSSRYGGGRQK